MSLLDDIQKLSGKVGYTCGEIRNQSRIWHINEEKKGGQVACCNDVPVEVVQKARKEHT